MKAGTIAQVSVPVPLRKTYDFLISPDIDQPIKPGARVQVPFGKQRHVTGIVLAVNDKSVLPRERLRPIYALLDSQPVFNETLFELLTWAAEYYHHPVGEVMYAALPAPLRRGRAGTPSLPRFFRATPEGRRSTDDTLRRAPLQARLLDVIRGAKHELAAEQLNATVPNWRRAMPALLERGFVEEIVEPAQPAVASIANRGPEPTPAQASATSEVIDALGGYAGFCLFGVTGSGKTEVYLRVIESALQRGLQALVLVPEIGLTPQLIERFRARFNVPIAVFHSQLGDSARHLAWWQAREGRASIVLGTRSAVFVPLKNPGLIIVDEEHDASYKQQEGFRYHARDLAVYRAYLESVPVILGSATPSLETWANIERGRYRRLELPARAGIATLPAVKLIDLNRVPVEHGLSRPLLDAVATRLARGEQILVFINRRGFAPVLYCTNCGWQAHCQRCDARLIFHAPRAELRCHHCGWRAPAPQQCGSCGATALKPVGAGTQRVEQVLSAQFPDACILRIDRDTIRERHALATHLARVSSGTADILVGTQLLAKGHDFPNVTLVAVIDSDQGLFSVDFRAEEHLVQQIMQVSGRAGRAQRAGEVLIQTRRPDHPLFATLQRHAYAEFADTALAERRAAAFPPAAHFALLRAESPRRGSALAFLEFARTQLRKTAAGSLHVGDPVPAPMEKRAGRFRAQLLVGAMHRATLQAALGPWLATLESSPLARRVRWSIDVDPVDMM